VKQRGAYASRVSKIVCTLKSRYPELTEDFISECVRRSWIRDITSVCYTREAEHMIEYLMSREEFDLDFQDRVWKRYDAACQEAEVSMQKYRGKTRN
jgi:hypothetical protein